MVLDSRALNFRALNSRALGSRVLNSLALNYRALNVRALDLLVLNYRALGSRVLDSLVLGSRALDLRAVEASPVAASVLLVFRSSGTVSGAAVFGVSGITHRRLGRGSPNTLDRRALGPLGHISPAVLNRRHPGAADHHSPDVVDQCPSAVPSGDSRSLGSPGPGLHTGRLRLCAELIDQRTGHISCRVCRIKRPGCSAIPRIRPTGP
ncbi:hypothetical protein [Amycolatopsis sp.]|uniref:hypothetical protein n=1 Tax=Amycolatopsis sp. TaxID=37632 RepID=UPI002C9EAE6B|nr:hypothetical protein [Amycolatopsis sp.]HVV13719.1 hypothetical protein [Amycolatopsis sp.]